MSMTDVGLLVAAALGVVGVIEWLKGFPTIKDAPSWVWRLAVAPVSVGVGFAVGGDVVWLKIVLVLTIAQLGYPLLVQLPQALIEKARKELLDKVGAVTNPPAQ